MLADVLVVTPPQKVLDFMVREPGKQFTAGEIQSGTKLSRAGTNAALRKLTAEKLILREKKALIYLYHIETINRPLIKQLKIVQNLVLIAPLVDRLKTAAEKIILYGSCSRGENTVDSDIDLLILTHDKESAEAETGRARIGKKLQIIYRTPVDFTEMEKKDREYYEEVSRGLVLWEAER